MAFTTPSLDNQGRWPQQLPHDFGIREASCFMPYNPHGNTAAQIQIPILGQYAIAPAHYSTPTTSIATTYCQSPYAFANDTPYQSSLLQQAGYPSDQELHDRSPMPMEQDSEAASIAVARRMSDTYLQSPIRDGSSALVANSDSFNPTAGWKTITYNETINPDDRVSCKTNVDDLIKVVQAKDNVWDNIPSQTLALAYTPKTKIGMDAQSPANSRRPASNTPKVEPREKWVCDGPGCNKQFKHKVHLDAHRRVHTGEKPYSCDICGKAFSHNGNLRAHKQTHNGLKPYVCTECNRGFSQRGNLRAHMRCHTGEKPYSCDICGKAFSRIGSLRAHKQTHHGLKPFIWKLDNCNKAFAQLGNMKRHQNNFPKETLHHLQPPNYPATSTMAFTPLPVASYNWEEWPRCHPQDSSVIKHTQNAISPAYSSTPISLNSELS